MSDEPIGQSVQTQLEPRIIDDSSTFDKTASEDAVPTFTEFLPVSDDVAGIVALVGHHDDHRIPARGINTANNRAAKAFLAGILNRTQFGNVRASRPRISQVESVLPSSTTTISWLIPLSRNSRCKCSTVEAMHPASSLAGITTLSRSSGCAVPTLIAMCRLPRACRFAIDGRLRFVRWFPRARHECPSLEMRSHFAQITVIANMIADAIFIDVDPVHRRTRVTLDHCESFENRATVVSPASNIVNLARTWVFR